MPLGTYGTIPPADFPGRTPAVKITCDRLAGSEFLSTAIVGGPKTGKTSLLRYLASDYVKPSLPNNASVRRVYVDADLLGLKASAFDFWIRLLRQLRTQESALAPLLTPAITKAENEKLNIYHLEDLFDQCAAQKIQIVAIIDNWESLLRNPNFWPPDNFLHLVRYFGQRVPRTLAFVLASQRPLLDLWDPTKGASPYYNVFMSVEIPRLADAEIESYVKTALAGVNGLGDLVAMVNAASYGHPRLVSYVAWLCGEIVAKKESPKTAAIEEAFQDPDGPLVKLVQEIRGALSPAERQLVDLARNNQAALSSTQKDRLRNLARYGLLPPGLKF
jgi:hypothetical protein